MIAVKSPMDFIFIALRLACQTGPLANLGGIHVSVLNVYRAMMILQDYVPHTKFARFYTPTKVRHALDVGF